MTSQVQAAAPAQRVLVGACGAGYGHISSQLTLIRGLRERGHRVALVTFGDGLRALDDAFRAEVPVIEPTHFPGLWVAMTPDGIDIAGSARNSRSLETKGDAWNFALCERVVEHLGGEPDVVLTDYEPASAQVAYMLGSRLITTEQQSKFLMYRTPDVAGFTRYQEAAKLRYFFPAADQRIAPSFFPLEWEPDQRYPGLVTEPIMRPDVLALTPEVDEDLVVVYLSPVYLSANGPLRQSTEKILAVLATFSDIRFMLFCSTPLDTVPDNVKLLPFDRQTFISTLAGCSAVISTAGHQLLSECVLLRKPVLGVPLNFYEQQFNAAMLDHFGMGQAAQELTGEVLTEFLARREEFAAGAGTLAQRHFTGEAAYLLDRVGL